MSYKVAIRRNTDGLIRLYEETYPWDEEEGSSYWFWTEGNYSCDCNRYLCFESAAGLKPDFDSPECECGEDRYTCLYAEFSDGHRVTLDERA